MVSARLLAVAMVSWCCLGCTSAKQSNTARTAREQMLISNAVDQSLAKIDFSAFQGSKIFLDEKYLDCVDKGYVVGSIRHHISMNGGQLVGKPEESEVIVEVRSGGVGTDISDSFLGTPEVVLPGMLTLPEVRFASRNNQSATAKIGLVAYDTKTMELLGAGGVSTSRSDDKNTYVMGVGPWQSGTVKDEMARSLPRRASQPWQELSPQVAFGGRSPTRGANSSDSARVRLTGGENGEVPVPPAEE